jgi:hypothetical protein
MSRNIPFRNFYPKFMNSHFCLTICMNFFTFISHLVSLQSKQPLFFPGVYSRVGVAQCSSSSGTISQRSYAFPRCDTCGRQHPGDCRCNIPHSGIKTIISCQPKNRVINIYIYIFMVFVLKSIKILTESPLYLKVPSYLHVTCLHF